MVVLISYADKAFFKSQKLLKKSALKHGADKVVLYDDNWLRSQREFYIKNKRILDEPRGAGYWIWKPYIILHTLLKLGDDDILIYIDSGAEIISDIMPLVRLTSFQDVVLFNNDGHKNKTWTKRDCFYYMNCDSEEYHNGEQVSAGYVVLKKTQFSIEMLIEWLTYCTDERVVTDQPNECGLPNDLSFQDHRHDQSVLSILALKYQIDIYRNPSQWGNVSKMKEFREENEFVHRNYTNEVFANSPYPTIVNSHRLRRPLNLFDRSEYGLKKIQFEFKRKLLSK